MEIEFSFQWREMLLFLTTNMVAMTSHANHQYEMSDKDFFDYFVCVIKWYTREIREKFHLHFVQILIIFLA